MKLSLKLVLPIIIVMLGCGSKPYVKHHIPQKYRAKNISEKSRFDSNSKNGILVFSVTQSSRLANGQVYFRSLTNNDTFYVKALERGGWGYGDSDFSRLQGRLFAIEVKSGRYTIKTWQIHERENWIFPRYKPEEIEFKIEPGKIVYIGEIYFHFRMGENLFGMSRVFGGYPEIKNSFERDYELFKVNYSRYSDIPYDRQVEEKKSWVGLEKENELNMN